MRAASRLELRQQVADVRLDRLLREEEALANLAVHEAVGDEPEDLGLARGRLLLELPRRRDELDDRGGLGVAVATGGDLVEAT